MYSTSGLNTCAPFFSCHKGVEGFFSLVSSLKLLAKMDGIVSTTLVITHLSGNRWRMQSSVALLQPVFSVSHPLLTLCSVTPDPGNSLNLTYAPGCTHFDADGCY